jgi:hypothetical protein
MTQYINAHKPTEDMKAAREFSKTNGGDLVTYATQGSNEYWFRTRADYDKWDKGLPNTVRAITHTVTYQNGRKIM